MERTFEVHGAYCEDPYTCIYFQYMDECAESCRLLEEYQSPVTGKCTRKLLKTRRIRETRGGDCYIIFRGRRLSLDNFLRPGGFWGAAAHTIEY